ncbi:hypothetical protein [Fodinibius salsisoli]|uniref:Uncharacterized protein n=1 Tax=Fodinibius salsisoli TaxID=2820877 RepID=A0ABT3PJM7_9BACT|nr:hypothetical protein [Fodinibius salsisoli]MCW9706145.1 hypothetical protein [Fodinibius salsisoli]
MQKIILSSVGVFILLSLSANVHAQFRDGRTTAKSDTISNLNVPVEYLLNPSLESLSAVENFSLGLSGPQPIQMGNVTKFLLKGGVSLLRGKSENIPLYSFENAWKYPGPTVEYPETMSEYEGFLQRYDQYNPDSQ